jgi:clan AA aspartic protease (TIGR02281 family)
MRNITFTLSLVMLTNLIFCQTKITMEKKNGVYFVPCAVNGLKLKFIFDTGAGDVSISLSEANFMIKNGYMKEEDLIGTEYYRIANGEIAEGTKIIIRQLEIGNKTLFNVEASIVHSLSAPLLLGQSAIQRFGKFSIDYSTNTLVLGSEKTEQQNSANQPNKYGKKYRISNSCDYSDDLKMECIYWIDGIKYNYKSEITLTNGKHTIKNYLRDKTDGDEYNDEISLYIDEKTASEIIVDLNCACPFFYYKNNLGNFYGGELIRNLNSIDKEGLDYMEINKELITSDTLRLTIKEEKDEISYVDEIYLNINDSIKLLARSDDKSINSNILLRDGKYEILKKGNAFDIYFIIPKNMFLERVKIYSYGYYLKNKY